MTTPPPDDVDFVAAFAEVWGRDVNNLPPPPPYDERLEQQMAAIADSYDETSGWHRAKNPPRGRR